MPNTILYTDVYKILYILKLKAARICDTTENQGLIERCEFYLEAYDIVERAFDSFRRDQKSYFEVD